MTRLARAAAVLVAWPVLSALKLLDDWTLELELEDDE